MRWLIAIAVAAALGPAAAQAQAPGRSPLSLAGGIGFTADPDAFMLAFEADYRLGQGFSLAPELQLGVDDDFTLVAPALNLRYWVDLSGLEPSGLRRLRPFLQGGLGFTLIDLDRAIGDDDDIGFLIKLGFGLDYPLTDVLSLTSAMSFNILPTDVFNEDFYFSWEVAGLRFRF